MTGLSGYSRSTFYGHLSGGEIFNWSLWANEAPADQAATQAQANAFAAEAKVAGTGVNNVRPEKLLSPDSGLDGVRVYSYAENSTKATYLADASIGSTGNSSATVLLPNQCAVVVTLKTAVAGRRHQGRVYLPINQWALSSQAQLSTANVQGIAGWFAEFLARLNSHIGTQRIGVLSRVGMTPTGGAAPTFQPITTVTVDSKIDIQRRRANKMGANSRFTQAVA